MKDLVSVIVVTRNRKKDLTECLNSLTKSSYKPLEIIVIDNASTEPIAKWLSRKKIKGKILTLSQNVGAAEGRNVGLKYAKGEYLLFIDDDAYVDKYAVQNLVEVFGKREQAGIVQPLIYFKQKKSLLQGAGHDINLLTGRIKGWGVRELDRGQYNGLRKVPMAGCVWMVKKSVIVKIGTYDKEYFIPYEDSDFSIRARKAGFEIYCYSKAKAYHADKKVTISPLVEWLGITTPDRAYRVSRNKLIFMKKHAPFLNLLIFLFIFVPIYIILHSATIIVSRRVDLLMQYWKGVLSGFIYILTK